MQLIKNPIRLNSPQEGNLRICVIRNFFFFVVNFPWILVGCFNALEALVESLGTLMGMGAGAAETELTMREEHFKVRAEWDGREVEFFQKDKHQTYKKTWNQKAK